MKRRAFFGRLVAALVGLVWKGPETCLVVGPPLDMNPFNWQSVPGLTRYLGSPSIMMVPALELDRLVRAEIQKLGKPSFTPLIPSTDTGVSVDEVQGKESP